MTRLFPLSPLRLFIVPLSMCLCVLFVATACDSTTSSCDAVQGTVTGQSVPVLDDGALTGFQVEKATVDGDLPGTSTATFSIDSTDGDGTMHLTGSHTFWDRSDAFLFRTRDEGKTTATGQIENTMLIIEGATGTLSTTGSVDLRTGALTLDYDGEVCR